MSEYLNHSLSFADIPSEHQKAFLGGRAEKRLLLASTLLYKFTDHPLQTENGRVTPWWSIVDPLADDDPGFAGSQRRADRLGVGGNDFARARSAVSHDWNGMSRLLWAELTRPVWALVGKCRHQGVNSSDAKVVLIGGAFQAYLPNLTRDHIHTLASVHP